MEKGTFWLLTDSLGQTVIGASCWRRWGRGVTHTVWPASISGYGTDSPHLPYLLDSLYERYGPTARLWLSEAGDLRRQDSLRVSANTWTTLVEWDRPGWVNGPADARVRLRLALLAAASAHPVPAIQDQLRGLSLRDLTHAAALVEEINTDGRRHGRVPQATCMAAMAIHSAAAFLDGRSHVVDLASRHYPVYAWYAAMAAACACVNLSALADEAVRREARSVARRSVMPEAVAVS